MAVLMKMLCPMIEPSANVTSAGTTGTLVAVRPAAGQPVLLKFVMAGVYTNCNEVTPTIVVCGPADVVTVIALPNWLDRVAATLLIAAVSDKSVPEMKEPVVSTTVIVVATTTVMVTGGMKMPPTPPTRAQTLQKDGLGACAETPKMRSPKAPTPSLEARIVPVEVCCPERE